MNDGISLQLNVNGRVDPAIAQGLADATRGLQGADRALALLTTSWGELAAAMNVARQVAASAGQAVEFVASLSAESDRLATQSARLGLNFNEAADGAGRFVDETEALAAASQLAEAGLHLTQGELNALTQRAAIVSQNLGIEVPEAFSRLTSAIESGSTRALRPLGEDMVALAGDAHTARDRLDALVHTTSGLPPATNDAVTSIRALKDAFGDAQRNGLDAFNRELEAINGPGPSSLTTIAQAVTSLADMAVTAGRRIADAWTIVSSVFSVSLNGLRNNAEWIGTLLRGDVEGFARFWSSARGQTLAGDQVNRLTTIANAGGRLLGNTGGEVDLGSPDRVDNAGQAGGADGWGAGASETAANQALTRMGGRMFHGPRTARHGGAGQHGETDAQRADRMLAEQRAANTRGREGLTSMFSGATAEVAANAESATAANTALKTAEQERLTREADARARDAETRRARDQQTSIGAGMRSALTQYGDTAMHTRDLVVGAFTDMTSAVGKHIEAVATGQETISGALQSMVTDWTLAVAKRASVSAAEEAVASIASLALGDFRGAGLHAAAAVGYTAVAGLAGAAAVAITPEKPERAGGASGAAGRAMSPTSTSDRKGDGGGSVVNVYFGGPVIGAGGARQAGREVVNLLNDAARQGDVRLAPQLLPMGSR